MTFVFRDQHNNLPGFIFIFYFILLKLKRIRIIGVVCSIGL